MREAFKMPLPDEEDVGGPATKRVDIEEAPATKRVDVHDAWDDKTGKIDEADLRRARELSRGMTASGDAAPETKRVETPSMAAIEVAKRFMDSVQSGDPMSAAAMIDDVTFWLHERPGMKFSTAEVLTVLRDKLATEESALRAFDNVADADAYKEAITQLNKAVDVATDAEKDRPLDIDVDVDLAA